MAACGTSSSRRPSPVDEDVDLVVDGDDSATYGPSQYSEQDVIVMSADGGPHEDKEREALREAVISPDGSKRSPGSCSTPTSSCGVRGGGGSGDAEVKEEPSPTAKSGGGLEDNLLTALEPDTINTVLEALKTRIRELEGETRVAGNDKFKCLICMERYKKPVISVCCWHVHCEECWLHTLGAKKLCPQCNMITSPSDLRRIYM